MENGEFVPDLNVEDTAAAIAAIDGIAAQSDRLRSLKKTEIESVPISDLWVCASLHHSTEHRAPPFW